MMLMSKVVLYISGAILIFLGFIITTKEIPGIGIPIGALGLALMLQVYLEDNK